MRLIDADALKQKYTMVLKRYKPNAIMERAAILLEDVDNAPTIDAEPIRYGKWIPSDPPDAPVTKLYKCSVCGLGYEDDDTDCEVYYPWKYCPHCGARMKVE